MSFIKVDEETWVNMDLVTDVEPAPSDEELTVHMAVHDSGLANLARAAKVRTKQVPKRPVRAWLREYGEDRTG